MELTTELLTVGMRQVLAELSFPAQRWQVIAQAQHYGAGYDFLRALDRLPSRLYQSMGEILAQLTAHVSAPPPPPMRVARRRPAGLVPARRPVPAARRASGRHPVRVAV